MMSKATHMKKHKYLNTLFLTYSAALLLALTLLFLVMLTFTYREQYKKNMEVQKQLADKTSEQLDTSLQEMDRIINGLLFNKSFMNIMKAEDAASRYTEYSKQILNHFVTLDAPLFSTHRIIAFNDSAYYTLTKTGENPSYIEKAIASYPYIEPLAAANGEKVLLPAHPDIFDEEGIIVYSVARIITDGKKSYGFVEVQNEYSRLENICTFSSASGKAAVFAADASLIFPYEAEEENTSFLKELHEKATESGTDQGSFLWKGQQVSYITSSYSGWITFIYAPASRFVPYALEMVLVSAAAFILLALLSLSMLHLLTKKMAAPLIDLNQALNQVSLDNLSLTLPQSYNIEEIESINHSFQVMFGHLKEAIAVSIQSRANEERANYLALQSQMNPHTIYNTISMIESVSYMNGDKEVSSLCICFSQMLRYISDYTRKEYKVQDEIQHLSNYAVLVQKRFAGKLDIQVSVDDCLLSRIIPKFTIQPLVENAVKHGYGTGYALLTISVCVEKIPEGWHILVKDDGCGFSKEALSLIQTQLAHCDASLQANTDVINMKIGKLALSNIYIRCRILYGDAFSVCIQNNKEHSGGYVELRISENPSCTA